MNHLFQNKEKTMRKERRTLLVPVISGLVLSMSSLSAAPVGSITWAPVSTSVPLSPASLALLAVMFLTAGSYLLYKSQNKAFRSMLSVLLLAGMFGFVKEAQAMVPSVTISSHNGNTRLYSGNSSIHNVASNIPVNIIVAIDNPDYGIHSNGCHVLQPGETCAINVEYIGPR
jgi:hypothetical protein